MTTTANCTNATRVGEVAPGVASAHGRTPACELGDVPVYLVGPARHKFEVCPEGDSIRVTPRQSLDCRHTIRPVALFDNARGYADLNAIMGRLVFPNGSAAGQVYRPFTLDPQRRLRQLYLPIEVMPDDDWHTAPVRWRNACTLLEPLLSTAGVPWRGLSGDEIDTLVTYVDWPDPLEGCLLHALTQWTHHLGRAVIEIGSFRGRSLSMLAMGLEGAGCESAVISVDPHIEQPFNRQHVQVRMREIGQEDRLIQVLRRSGDAARLLRPETASLVFVDGDHSYDQVVADFANYRHLLAVGGCMLFHDYGYGAHQGQEDVCPGVGPAVDEHVLTDPAFKPLVLVDTTFAFVKTTTSAPATAAAGQARRLPEPNPSAGRRPCCGISPGA
ncbi:MAG TPA: class I SAM-dependent methyltransferase [Phycisphaerae bacterium]|nr:class I SAM-dependent methyltransferase [Phycisphaerae bacterium]